jgi:predicted permease
MDALLQDLRYALRRLGRSPGFTAAAVLTLALGIGATTTIFGVVDGLLLRPLPFAEPDRLVRVYPANPERGVERGAVSPLELEDWREQGTAFAGLAGWFGGTTNLTGTARPEALRSAFVTEAFFGTLGTGAGMGRTLTAEEVAAGARSVVLSHRLWQRDFGGDPDVVGSVLTLDGAPHTVVGVMPPEFRFPGRDTDLWLPVSLLTEDMIPRLRQVRWLSVVGRLRPGVAPEEARAQMSAIAERLAAEHPASNAGWSRATVLELRETIVGDVRPALLVTLLAVGFVLLMVCVNLGNLLLARGSARAREMGVRGALGAGRGRLARQLLSESLVLALLGGAAGLLLTVWGTEAIRRLGANVLPRVDAVAVDARVLAFALAVSLLAALLFGLVPALRAARPDLHAVLKEGGRGSVGDQRNRLRRTLVVGQVAMATVLTIGAALMLRNLGELRRVDPGFDPQGLLAVRVQLTIPLELPAEQALAHLASRGDEILERLASLPGVSGVAAANSLPLLGEGESIPVSRPDAEAGGAETRIDGRFVTPDFFRVMGIPLLAGADFPARVPAGGELLAVLGETAARRLWPGEDPVGRTLNVGGSTARVIGVVGDVRYAGLAEPFPPTLYLHRSQALRSGISFLVRTPADPAALAGPARDAVWSVDPDQPILAVSALREVVADSVARDRFFTLLLTGFGALALLLAVVGIYGLLAFAVTQRTREIGVRVALGARAPDVVRMIVGSGMALVAGGVVIGLLAALATTRLLAGLLQLVSATDPATFVGVPLVLAAAALLASWLPARRAARVDPMAALRTE